MKTQLFHAGTVFESDTLYTAAEKEYHIFPEHVAGTVDAWYTTSDTDGKPPVVAYIMKNLRNVTVDLGGAKLIFHGRIMPFAVFDCENITFRNFSIDYDRPFYTQGTVVEVGNGEITLDIPEQFGFRVEDDYLIAVSDTWENNMNNGTLLFSAFKPDTGRLSSSCSCLLGLIGTEIFPSKNPPLEVHHLYARYLGGRRVCLSGFPDSFTPDTGDILAATHEDRKKLGFLAERCVDTVFENIRLIHVSSMGCSMNLCHNITFRNFSTYLDDECKGRIISINADVLHGFHCSGKIIVEDCRFESMLDDAFNFHGNYAKCISQADEHTLLLRNCCAGLRHMQFYLPGDTVTVYRGNTLEVRGVYTVASSELIDDTDLTLTTVEPVTDFTEGDLVESMRVPEIEIRRCNLSKARGRWLLSSSAHVLMEDCVTNNSSINFTGDMNYWYENTGARDVEIRNCTFVDCACSIHIGPAFTPTEAEPYYHKNIRIINNRFINCAKTVLIARHTDGVIFKGNTDADGCLIGEEAVKAFTSDHIAVN